MNCTRDFAMIMRDAEAGVDYPPFGGSTSVLQLREEQRRELLLRLKEYSVCPNNTRGGLLSDSPLSIPYCSNKTQSINRAGRKSFETYKYVFRIPQDLEHRLFEVYWDYQIGLVRITPFFKAYGYSKTMPAKAITTNQGLKSVCFSTTGGSLAAQGYWMPYDCARALCKTFCFSIRWALTPVFDPHFAYECLEPNHPDFGSFKIDAFLIEDARFDMLTWEGGSSATGQKTLMPCATSIAVKRPVDRKQKWDFSKCKTRSRRRDADQQVYEIMEPPPRPTKRTRLSLSKPESCSTVNFPEPNEGVSKGWAAINDLPVTSFRGPSGYPSINGDLIHGAASQEGIAASESSNIIRTRNNDESDIIPDFPQSVTQPARSPRTESSHKPREPRIPSSPLQMNSPLTATDEDHESGSEKISNNTTSNPIQGPADDETREGTPNESRTRPTVTDTPTESHPRFWTLDDYNLANWLLELKFQHTNLDELPRQSRRASAAKKQRETGW